MNRNFPTDRKTMVEVECCFWVIAWTRAQLQFCERRRRDREFFLASWFGSELWEECREEMTPEDHPECWFLPAPSSQLNPMNWAEPGWEQHWRQVRAVRAAHDPEQPPASSTQGPVPQNSWVVFQEAGSPPQNPGSTGRSEHRHIVSSEQSRVAGSRDGAA